MRRGMSSFRKPYMILSVPMLTVAPCAGWKRTSMSTGGWIGPCASGLTTVMVGALKSAPLLINRAPGAARAVSSDWYSRGESSRNPCSAAPASDAASSAAHTMRAGLDGIGSVLSMRGRIDPDGERPGGDLALACLDHQCAGAAGVHLGEHLLHLAGGIAPLGAELEQVDLLVGGKAERPGRPLVAGVVLVRIQHGGAVLAVHGDHVEVTGARHRYLEHDLLADVHLLPAAAHGDRLSLRGERRQRLPGGSVAVAQRDQRQLALDEALVAVGDWMMPRLLVGVRGDEGRRRAAQVVDRRVLAVARGVLDGADDAEGEQAALLGADGELVIARRGQRRVVLRAARHAQRPGVRRLRHARIGEELLHARADTERHVAEGQLARRRAAVAGIHQHQHVLARDL